MSYVAVQTKAGLELEVIRGASNGTLVVVIGNGSIFFDSRGVKSLREFICREIEKGWIK